MAWTRKQDPEAPTPPAFHHPDRCMTCGHLKDEHDTDVGCISGDGIKYVEDDQGNAKRTCTCEAFAPVPEAA